MTRVFVGISCAVLSVVLLVYAVWRSAGMSGGMPSLLTALALMLVAVLTLRPRRTTRSSR